MPQRTLVPSFFYLLSSIFLSFYLSFCHFSIYFSLSLFLSLYLSFRHFSNYMYFHVIYQVKGHQRASVGMCGVFGVCAGMRRYAPVCAGVRGCAWVCVDMHGCGMYFQNFLWRIESLHQRTLIRFLRVVHKKRNFSFPILAFFILNNLEKYSHTQKISSKC